MTDDGVRGLAEAMREILHAEFCGCEKPSRVHGDAYRGVGRRAAETIDARLGSGEVVEAVARFLSPGMWWDVPGALHDRDRDRVRRSAAAAVEAVRAALMEGEGE